jgi:hypothetical protein
VPSEKFLGGAIVIRDRSPQSLATRIGETSSGFPMSDKPCSGK